MTESLAKSGAETNRLYRQNYGITHNGVWDWGKAASLLRKTNNTVWMKASSGGEGRISADEKFTTNRLTSGTSGEPNIPLDLWSIRLDRGARNRDELDDPSTGLSVNDNIGGILLQRRTAVKITTN